MYKAVLFDLDNTLLNYDSCELDAMKRAIQHHKLGDQSGFLWDSFWKTYLNNNLIYWEQRIARNLTILQVLEYALRDTFGASGPPSLAQELAGTYWSFFCSTCHFEQDAYEIVHWSKMRYKLGIVSNGIGEAQRLRLQTGNMNHLFDAITVSDEAGHWKPDPKIFDHALEQLQTERRQTLFVGDSLRDDYYGALNAGIDFCFYNRKRQQVEAHIKPKYIISELSELRSIL